MYLKTRSKISRVSGQCIMFAMNSFVIALAAVAISAMCFAIFQTVIGID